MGGFETPSSFRLIVKRVQSPQRLSQCDKQQFWDFYKCLDFNSKNARNVFCTYYFTSEQNMKPVGDGEQEIRSGRTMGPASRCLASAEVSTLAPVTFIRTYRTPHFFLLLSILDMTSKVKFSRLGLIFGDPFHRCDAKQLFSNEVQRDPTCL